MKYKYVAVVLIYDMTGETMSRTPKSEYIHSSFTHKPTDFELWNNFQNYLMREINNTNSADTIAVIDDIYEKIENQFLNSSL